MRRISPALVDGLKRTSILSPGSIRAFWHRSRDTEKFICARLLWRAPLWILTVMLFSVGAPIRGDRFLFAISIKDIKDIFGSLYFLRTEHRPRYRLNQKSASAVAAVSLVVAV